MVHSLIPMSVDIKTRIFENPARLVNAMELTCAIGMAYFQAGLELPEIEVGMTIKDFWSQTTPQIKGNARVKESLQHVIMNYIFKKGEVVEEDSVITLKLGYEFR
ncbi:MAG: DUF3837 family protein [Lachnospiraceae bacterium]|nr:DUF3837 family protein [Lachnospiraceae bacterium]